MRQCTLCFIVRDNPTSQVLLGMKKRGFGKGKWNGLGGKVAPNESVEAAACREFYEEAAVQLSPDQLTKAAELTFLFTNPPAGETWDQVVHVFVAREWEGLPRESDEMRPEWFDTHNLPFDSMWKDDPHWLPLVLEGKKIKARFTFDADNESIVQKELTIVNEVP